jgi:aspartate/methionine/tyrosine aminotransferase
MPAPSSTARRIRPGVFAELQRHIDARAAKGEKLIPLHIGDTCIPPPDASRAVLRAGVDDAEHWRYGPTGALADLKAAIATRLRAARGLSWVEAEKHVLVGAGGTHALGCLARAALEPGDEILLAAPYWPLAHGVFASAAAVPIEVPLMDRLYADPSLDPADVLREAITPKTRAIYFVSPNNPDGKVLSREQLEKIAALAEERDLWVFADEVYADIAFERPHVSFASLEGMDRRTVSLYSFSKSHALAGARVGYVVAPEPLVALARRVSVHTIFNVPLVMQQAALAALAAGDQWIKTARDRHRSARDAAANAARSAGLRFHLAEGGTYLFVDLTEPLDGRPLADLLARAIDEGVMLAPGEAFGAAYARHARICYTSAPILDVLDGITRLRRAIESF